MAVVFNQSNMNLMAEGNQGSAASHRAKAQARLKSYILVTW